MTYVIRSARDPMQLVPSLRAAIAGVDRTAPVFNIKTVEEYQAMQLQPQKQYMTLLGIFSGIAVILAMVGVYGLMAYAVRQRTQEIGIRMALGAGQGNVLWFILRRGLLLVVLGTAFGLAAALALTRFLQVFLWGVTPTDPLTFLLVIAALAAAALLACYLPARRASQIDPMIALRYE